jgi:ubiquinone/menaquinone biosynthesis C-methylase UbiE
MGKTGKAAYDPFAVGYSLWGQTRGQDFYKDALSFLPPYANFVLDAGCGPGILSLQLSDHVNRVVGLDISRSMIIFAKTQQTELKKDNVDFVVADLMKLPFKEGIFDFIASYNALRFRSIELKLSGLSHLLKPGGRMVIYENITPTSRLVGGFPLWQVLSILKSTPKNIFNRGLRTSWHILSFRLSPGWIRYLWKSQKITPEVFQDIYSHLLPGCTIKKKAWRMIAFWEAPGKGRQVLNFES